MTQSEDPQAGGFGHSKRRIVGELGLLVGGAALLLLLGVWVVSSAADWLLPLVPKEVDEAIGSAAWSTTTPQDNRCTNPAAKAYVESLAAKLLPHDDSGYEFQFTVADDDAVNAFALPGGFVTVNMGLLREAQDGEEVAGVLAHELAHVTERHGTRRVLRSLGTAALVSFVFGGTDVESAAALLGQLSQTAYDREQEADADSIGISMLKAASIDPRGMSHFFERISEDELASAIPEVLSTHPDPGDRAERAAAAAQGFTASERLPAPGELRCR